MGKAISLHLTKQTMSGDSESVKAILEIARLAVTIKTLAERLAARSDLLRVCKNSIAQSAEHIERISIIAQDEVAIWQVESIVEA